jgi:hypothetical protein
VLGSTLMLAYERFGDRRPFIPLLLLILPAIVKLLVACAVVGWRKALIPQEPRTPIFLPFTDRQTAAFAFWIEVVCVVIAVRLRWRRWRSGLPCGGLRNTVLGRARGRPAPSLPASATSDAASVRWLDQHSDH